MSAALLVIDMQNDYLYERRKRRFSYDTEQLTSAVNALIHRYRKDGCAIVYIRHIIQNLPTNRLLFGYSIAGTEGAKLYDGLEVVSEYIFDKLVGDALSNRALRSFLKDRGCDTLYLCGLDACGCVAATALGAVRRGIRACILREGVATMFDEAKVTQTAKKLERAGVRYI